MIILISVVTISGNKMSNNRKLANFATEISTIQDAVDAYLSSNPNDYPILNSVNVNLTNVSQTNRLQFTNNGDIITNNSINLYEIDYNKINYTNLQYGTKKNDNTDVYLMSASTSKVYYIKGFKSGENVYYTFNDELKKVINYQTSDTQVEDTNDLIYYEQNDIGNSKKQVKVNIPVTYTNPIVKIGSVSYNGTVVGENKVYEITTNAGATISITYTDGKKTKSTTYTVKE
jgi:hypothetical protein